MTTPQRRHPFEMFAATYVEDWTESSLCSQVDVDLCYPERGEEGQAERRRMIRRVCAACPVRPNCAKRARDNREKFGWWAGENAASGDYDRVLAKWDAIASELAA